MSVCLVSAADVNTHWPQPAGPIMAVVAPDLRSLPKRVIAIITPDLPGGLSRRDGQRTSQVGQ